MQELIQGKNPRNLALNSINLTKLFLDKTSGLDDARIMNHKILSTRRQFYQSNYGRSLGVEGYIQGKNDACAHCWCQPRARKEFIAMLARFHWHI